MWEIQIDLMDKRAGAYTQAMPRLSQ